MKGRKWILATAGLALACGLTTDTLAAQRRGFNDDRSGGSGFFMVGIQNMDLDELNFALTSNGYPDFHDNFFSLGGGGYGVRNRLVIGGEGHALLQSGETTFDGGFRTSIAGGFGMFNLGYQVVRTGNLAIYPLIGIGGGGITLSISERVTVDFDDVLDDPGRSARLTTGAFVVGGALGADWFVPLGNARGGMVIGVRGGYNYSPIETDWDLEGSDVAGGPDVALTGPFVRLSIGGGRR
jgi:hypothetical protein